VLAASVRDWVLAAPVAFTVGFAVGFWIGSRFDLRKKSDV